MGEWEHMNKPLRDLMEIIHFTENVSAKIHGMLDEAEIYRTVKEEFAQSKRYTASILLLTDDGSSLRIAETSLSPGKLKAGEKAAGLRLKQYKIDLKKSSIFSQVVREGKTVQANVSDIVGELFPQPLAKLISKITGYHKRSSILTPLKRHGKIIGALAMSSTDLAEHFIPSVRSLAQHISTALELADENAERKRAEEELRKYRDHLEELVEERTAELIKANEKFQQEITERKWAEEELRESEKRFRRMAELSPLPVSIIDPDGRYLYINKQFIEVFGYTLEDIPTGKEWFAQAYPDPEYRREAISAWLSDLEKFGEYEVRPRTFSVTCKDGTVREILFRSVTMKGEEQFIIYEDITERQRAEEEIRRRSNELAALYDTALDVTAQLDLQRLLHTIVERATDLLKGYGGGLYLYRQEHDDLEFVLAYKLEPDFTGSVLKRGEGLSGKVLESGQPMIVDNYRTWSGRAPIYEGTPFETVIAVPVKWGEQVLGVINVLREPGATFDEEDIRLLTLFANEAAVALENARLYEETQRRLQELEMLHRVSTSIISTLELDKTLQLIMDSAVKAIPPAQKGSLHLLDEQRNELVMRAGCGFSPEVMEAATFKVGEGYAGWAFAHNRPVIIENVKTDPRTKAIDLPEVHEEKSSICVPLAVKGKAIGTITLDNVSSYGAFDEDDLRLLSAFAAQAATAIENARLYEAAQRELAERKRAEKALRESEKKYRDLVENISDVIYVVDKDGVITYISPVIESFIGYSPSEVMGRSFTEFIPQEDLQRIMKSFQRILAGHIEANEYRVLTKSGEIRWMRTSSRPIFMGNRVIGVQGVLVDITERKQAEEALAKERNLLRTVIDNLPDYIYVKDTESRFVIGNIAVGGVMGATTPDELVGKTDFDFYPQELAAQYYADEQEIIRSGQPLINREEPFVDQVSSRGGWLLSTKVPLRDSHGKIVGLVGIGRDITERKKMEEELRKASKLESVGILAGGIAHDFNNILTAIIGNISFAKRYTSPGDELLEILTEAEKASLRAKDLTQQLLTFAKGGALVKKTASIAELIKDSASFALRGSNVQCEFSIPNDLWPVEMDKGQISQVINNLIINADQAMPEGGIIKVRAENMTVGAEEGFPLKEGKYVKVSIEDQGIGIPEEHLPKIFDPYFTTKQKGSGLGLAISYSIVKKHDGYITVESELGVGTTFYIYLPASEKEILTKKEAEEKHIVGQGKILIMDDQETIRDVAGRLLSLIGYEVDFAKDGAEAIELYKQAKESGHPFDAVIMDLTIPGGVGGKEAIQKLLEIDPNAKAIVSSGYSTDPIMADFREYGFSGVVAKPYKIEELSEALRKVIKVNLR